MIFPQLPHRGALFRGIQQALWKLQIEGQLQNICKTCRRAYLITSQCMRSISHIHQVSNTAMSNISWSTMMTNSTQSRSNTTSASMLSAGGVPMVPNPIGGPPSDKPIGPLAALKQCAATLLQRAIQAAAVARDAVADAADINNTHATIVAPYRKIFLARAFGINPDGTPIIIPSLLSEKLKTYKSIKSVKQ